MSQTQATKRRPNGAALIIAAGLAAVGSVLIWQGFAIPDKGGYAGVGSGGLPKFIGFGLLALALGHLVTTGKSHKSQTGAAQLGPVLWIVAGLALQLALLRPLGFCIASGLLFAFTATGLSSRKLWATFPIGIALSVLIYGVFDQLLKLKLPAGILETLIFGG